MQHPNSYTTLYDLLFACWWHKPSSLGSAGGDKKTCKNSTTLATRGSKGLPIRRTSASGAARSARVTKGRLRSHPRKRRINKFYRIYSKTRIMGKWIWNETGKPVTVVCCIHLSTNGIPLIRLIGTGHNLVP